MENKFYKSDNLKIFPENNVNTLVTLQILMVFLLVFLKCVYHWKIILSIFSNLSKFNVRVGVSLVCIQLENDFYKPNKLWKSSFYFSIISLYFDGLLISTSVVFIELKNDFHNFYKYNKLQTSARQCFDSVYRIGK